LSYFFSLGVSLLWLLCSIRQSHLFSIDHTINAYNALLSWSIGDFHLSPPRYVAWTFLPQFRKTIQDYYQWGNFEKTFITSFICMIISHKTRLFLNSYMGVHFSSFHFKNSTESFILVLSKLKFAYRSLSLGSQITFYSLWTHGVLNDYSTICTIRIRIA
jgi:ABC-type glycerol-3-phosphate transport system permease component